MLALNVVTRPLRSLLRPLDYQQAAPPLFLWAEHAMARLFGVSEVALRVVPLLAGVGVLILVWRLGIRLFDPATGAVAAALASVSPFLVYYSNEVKPYETDAFFAAAVLYAGLEAGSDTGGPRRLIALAVLGTIAVAASIPAAFVLAGVWTGLAVAPTFGRRPEDRRWLILAGLGPATVFGLIYLFLYRREASSKFLLDYWSSRFPTLGRPDWLGIVWRAGGETIGDFCFGTALPAAVTLLMLGLLVAGLIPLTRRRGAWVTVALVGPVLITMIASTLHRYPLEPRLLLFLAPVLCLLLAGGMRAAAEVVGAGRTARVQAGLACTLLSWPAYGALRGLVYPFRPEDSRPVINAVIGLVEPGQAIYISSQSLPAWLFYTTDWHAPDVSRIRRMETPWAHVDPAAYRGWVELAGEWSGSSAGGPTRADPVPGWADAEAARIRGAASCTWLVYTSYREAELVALRAALDQLGAVPKAMLTREPLPWPPWPRVVTIEYCFPATNRDAAY
ncbi:MAG TPA: glycosyltransferase family 39 protein [Gemmatimonadales bacterium]